MERKGTRQIQKGREEELQKEDITSWKERQEIINTKLGSPESTGDRWRKGGRVENLIEGRAIRRGEVHRTTYGDTTIINDIVIW